MSAAPSSGMPTFILIAATALEHDLYARFDVERYLHDEGEKLVRRFDARAAVAIDDCQPPLADDHDDRLAIRQGRVEDGGKVPTRLDALDVDEHALRAEVGHEVIVESSGVAGRVVSPIADEDPGRARPCHDATSDV